MKVKTVELHLLQSFPPSCVNRDGNNSPKDCDFGGYRRARISSQCFKRAIRQAESFAETVGDAIAIRSKQMRDKKLIPYLLEQGLDPAEAEKTADEFRRVLAKDDKKANQTSVGLYFGDAELFALLDAFRRGDTKLSGVATRVSADVALFGRMLAEAAYLNVDAAAQVAHAISTHALRQESDYWTAADDLKEPHDDAGASMLGTSEFNASVFYRYAAVSVPILRTNLADEEMTKRTVEAFLRASYEAVPTGKISGHAHSTAPFLALAVVRTKGMPINLCNAFLQPVRPTPSVGIDAESAARLLGHLAAVRKFAPVDEATYILAHQFPHLATADSLRQVEGYGDLVHEVVAQL